MPSENLENLRAALERYLKAKAEHEKLLKKQRARAIKFFAAAVILTAGIYFSFVAYFNSDSYFYELCSSGTVAEIQEALATGKWSLNIHAANAAIKGGNVENLKFFLDSGIEINNDSALDLAIENQRVKMIYFLNEEKGADLRKALSNAKDSWFGSERVKFLEEVIANRPALTQEKIIAVAEKYNFENTSKETFYIEMGEDRKKVFAYEKTLRSGNVYLGLEIIRWEDTGIIFESGYYSWINYSGYRNNPARGSGKEFKNKVREMFSKRLSGAILEKTVEAFYELTY
ncbi:MAG: ankyrin repeat domain-containing protein [Synergistaceae bacterium]|nr:ankyrin repeat domain-containing protein [Synergistaceae bacterium]